ncbi:SMI1/KNR4 family protein [Fictibacillus nanhaiensis]|uniref:SMI1/KNR4 family protein n=1 Tax=Fictibacillus nanhaiensis TaxID=742169 RepID=UPI003C2848C2
MKVHQAFDIIENHADEGDFIGEIEEEMIVAAETDLKVIFPKSYRFFLKRYGAGDIFGEEIFGLGLEESGIPSMPWITKKLREEEGLPNSLICVYSTGYDNEYYCLDCSNVKDSEGDGAQVVLYVSGLAMDEQSFEVVAKDFGEFLWNTLQESM